MAPKRYPPSRAILPAAGPTVGDAPEAILTRAFTLLEAAFLVAEEEEWSDYLVVGGEPEFLDAFAVPAGEPTRWRMRRELETQFWRRIQQKVAAREWLMILVDRDGAERAVSDRSVRTLNDPFAPSAPGATQSVFEALNQTPTHAQKEEWEGEAVAYMREWARGKPERILVGRIGAEIERRFPQYNFGPRAVTRIRKKAGLIQRRGPIRISE